MGSVTEVYTYTQMGSSAVGMLMRDHIAIEAMQAIIGKHEPFAVSKGATQIPEEIARGAYRYADAMMEARKA